MNSFEIKLQRVDYAGAYSSYVHKDEFIVIQHDSDYPKSVEVGGEYVRLSDLLSALEMIKAAQ